MLFWSVVGCRCSCRTRSVKNDGRSLSKELRPMRSVQSRIAMSVCAPMLVVLAGCGQPASTPAPAAAPAAPAAAPAVSQVERGHMLIIGGGCHDCHTPKKMGPNGPEADLDKSLSGHPESDGVLAKFKDAERNLFSA